MFVINHLTKQYGTEFALQDVTMCLGKGMHFIVGASGSGKTTLLKILSGMEGDFEGEVSYNGKPMGEFSSKEKSGLYHGEFGFVWQDFHLLEEATVLQNVLLPAGLRGGEKSAQSVLRQMKLEDLQHQKVKNLSGGQKQRVAIAREMMKNPKVIFCDEPTSALDGKSAKIVMDILHVLAKSRTVIVVTHDTSFIGKNDAVYELDKGELVSAPENQPGKVPAYQSPAFPRLSVGSALTLAARNLKNNVGRFLISALALVVSGTLLLTTFNGILSKSGQGEFDRLVDTYGESILDIDLVGSFMSASGTGGTQEEKPNGDVDQDIGGLYEKYQDDSRVAFLVTMQAFEDIQATLEGKSYTVEKSGNSPVLTKLLSGTIPAGEDFQVVIPLKLAEKMGFTPETALGKTMDFSASAFQWQGNTPIPKPVKLTATICGVADNTVVYDYEEQHSSFTVDDSFFFNRSAIEEIRSQAGIADESANFTALQNVLLASEAAGVSPGESRPKTQALLEKLSLAQQAGKKIETLSGGQKQRTAIARALMNDPAILLADEPTGALDRANANQIMELLKALSRDRLMLVITHDQKCAQYAGRILTITDGKLNGGEDAPLSEEPGALKQKNTPKVSMGKRAIQNVRIRLLRCLAIALAVSLGILCFTLALSSGSIIRQSIADFEAKNTAYHNGYIRLAENDQQIFQLLSQDSRIEKVYLQYVLSGVSLEMEGKTVEMEEKYPMAKAAEEMSYGVMPQTGKNEIALSPSLAAQFSRDIQSLLGKTLRLSWKGQAYQLTVSGIFNASYDDFFLSDDLEQSLYTGMSGKAYSLSYDVREFGDIVKVSTWLEEQGISSQNASRQVAAFQTTFRNLNRLFFTISLLILGIGLFISSILLIKQQNTRYHEVGLMAALGYGRGQISAMIVLENLLLSAIAAAATLVLTGVSALVGKALGFDLVLTLWQALGAVGLSCLAILVIGFLASHRLVHTQPADALRK